MKEQFKNVDDLLYQVRYIRNVNNIKIVLGDMTKFNDGIMEDEVTSCMSEYDLIINRYVDEFQEKFKKSINNIDTLEKEELSKTLLMQILILFYESAKEKGIKRIAIPIKRSLSLKNYLVDITSISVAVSVYYANIFDEIYLYVNPSDLMIFTLCYKDLMKYRNYHNMAIIESNNYLKEEDLYNYLFEQDKILSEKYHIKTKIFEIPITELYIDYLNKTISFKELLKKYEEKNIEISEYYYELTERKKHDYNFMIEKNNVNVYISKKHLWYKPTEYARISLTTFCDIRETNACDHHSPNYSIDHIKFTSNNFVHLHTLDFDKYNNLKYTYYNGSKYIGTEENPYLILVKAVPDENNNFVMHEDTINMAFNAFTYTDDEGNYFPIFFDKIVIGYSFNSEITPLSKGRFNEVFLEDGCYGYSYKSMEWLSKGKCVVAPYLKLTKIHKALNDIKPLFILGYFKYGHQVDYDPDVILSYYKYLQDNTKDLLKYCIKNLELLEYLMANRLLDSYDIKYLLSKTNNDPIIYEKLFSYKQALNL